MELLGQIKLINTNQKGKFDFQLELPFLVFFFFKLFLIIVFENTKNIKIVFLKFSVLCALVFFITQKI